MIPCRGSGFLCVCRRRRRSRLRWLATLPCVLLVAWHPRSESPYPELVRAFYDVEVAAYCGLVSDTVQSGFDHELEQIMQSQGIDDEGMQQARMQAWKEANLEWQNRGLGGFKGWCRTEGQQAVERFTRSAP